MKIWAHGSNVNFQTSAREMIVSDFVDLIQPLLASPSVIIGKIDPEKQELFVYGTVTEFELRRDEEQLQIQTEEPVSLNFKDLLISHEAVFDIVDEEKGKVRSTVFYLTFEEETKDTIYFLVDEDKVTHPLACVTEFWSQVEEVGREMDLSGCTALPFMKGRS